MADGATIVLPTRQQTLEPNDAGMTGQLGPALRQRPPDYVPLVDGDGDGPDIRIDLGGMLEVGDDGSIGAPAVHTHRDENENFGENLAERPEMQSALAGIAAEIIEGVDADEMSRADWISQYTKGIDLLGLKIEELNQSQSQGRKRDVSRANDTTLIEAMVKYEAGAEAELCPAGGPVKVPTIGRVSKGEEQLAKDFEDDFNYYLTDVAEEYYPDTAMMLMHQGFCGLGYKKVYFCPIRRRPVSESVLAPNLIVSEEATDLKSARRVTHQIEMIKSQLRRMQIVGQYRDFDIGMPQGIGSGIGGQAQRKVRESEGRVVIAQRPQDTSYVIRECDTDLDIDQYGIDGKFERAAPWGLPLPYKVTVEANTRQVLGIWRNWNPKDQLYLKRNAYVKFGLVPGLGFHNWGFLQLLGNQTRNMRSILRLLITAGMFANFPGGMKGKSARTATNEIAPAPGEFVDVDLPPGTDLSKVVVPLPYKSIDPALVQVLEMIKQDAMRLGGTVMLEVGEGRTNVPVGTVLAMIEQQIQVMAAVHKRNHRAQREELNKLRELFADDPSQLSLMVRNRPRDPAVVARQWELAQEFMDLNLQPASDPNVPSQVHRVMLANVLIMLAQTNQNIYDIVEVHRSALQAIGADPDRFLVRPEQQQQQAPAPDPKVLAAIQKNQNDQIATAQKAQADADKVQLGREQIQADLAKSVAENTTQREVEQMKTGSQGLGAAGGGVGQS